VSNRGALPGVGADRGQHQGGQDHVLAGHRDGVGWTRGVPKFVRLYGSPFPNVLPTLTHDADGGFIPVTHTCHI